MKRGIAFLFSLVLWGSASLNLFAQKDSFPAFGNKFNFEYDIRKLPGSMDITLVNVPDTAIYKALSYLAKGDPIFKPKSSILLGVKLSPKASDAGRYLVRALSKRYSAYLITDSSEAILVAMGINSSNIKDYQYRVVEDDSLEIIPWSKIPGLQMDYGAKQSYGFIGKFKSPGKQLFIEVRNIKNYGIRDGIIFDWRVNFKPKILEISLGGFKNGRAFRAFLKKGESNEGLATQFDAETHLPLNLKFRSSYIRQLYLILDDYQAVPYDVTVSRISKDTTEVIRAENGLTDGVKVISTNNFDSPGKYELTISRSKSIGPVRENDLIRIPFEVLPWSLADWNLSGFWLSYVIVALGLVSMFGMAFYSRNKAAIRKAERDQQLATLKLKSIRSQLNPHFMFNALSSIQNLINKNNITDANFYLSKFAGLTRQVLDSNNENMISLDDELRMLTDYLEMEQLRFSFRFEIVIDPLLNQANIEVPAMLIQPFIENAVKHGVSGLKHDGLIQIMIKGLGTDLEMKVQDNGLGYELKDGFSGYGIKLSEERIALLNQLYKGQSLSLTTTSTSAGTTVIIRLSNWIS